MHACVCVSARRRSKAAENGSDNDNGDDGDVPDELYAKHARYSIDLTTDAVHVNANAVRRSPCLAQYILMCEHAPLNTRTHTHTHTCVHIRNSLRLLL